MIVWYTISIGGIQEMVMPELKIFGYIPADIQRAQRGGMLRTKKISLNQPNSSMDAAQAAADHALFDRRGREGMLDGTGIAAQ